MKKNMPDLTIILRQKLTEISNSTSSAVLTASSLVNLVADTMVAIETPDWADG